jgi:hypothetical protein
VVVVVVVGTGGRVVVLTVGPAAVPVEVGWITPRSSTVVTTKAARTMTPLMAEVF